MKFLMKKTIAIILSLCFVFNICITTTYAYIENDAKEQIEEKNETTDEYTSEELTNKDNQKEQKETVEKTEKIEENSDKENSDKENSVEEKKEDSEQNQLQIEEKKETTTRSLKQSINELQTESVTEEQETEESTEPSIQYETHVQNIGWQGVKKDGETAGTSGRGYRLEAIKINLDNVPNVKVKYQVHVQNVGWQGWKEDGKLAGTEGRALRLEAIKIKLDSTNDYTVKYRVHIQNFGWQDWKEDGELAGTEGKGLRLEAIEIKLIKKITKAKMYIDTPNNTEINSPRTMIISGWKMSNITGTKIQVYLDDSKTPIDANCISYIKREDVIAKITGYGTEEQNKLPGFNAKIPTSDLTVGTHKVKIKVCVDNTVLAEQIATFVVTRNTSIEYTSHLQNIGWQGYVENGDTSGAENSGLRLEALKINLYNSESLEGTIKYSAHVQDIGWQNYVENNTLAGTEGKSKRIEALKIELTGELSEKYDIYYKTYVEQYGWLDWAKNGEPAGTEGLSFRLEGLQIKLVEKGTNIETSGSAFVAKPKLSYKTHVGFMGWQNYLEEGNITGTIGYSLRIEALKMKIENTNLSGTVQCSSHVQDIGWMNFVNAEQVSGTEGRGLRVEGIKIKLTGELEKYFDIYYRTHVENFGWISWAKNGEAAGTQGYSYRLEALQIYIVPKGADAPGKTSGHFYNKALERKSIEGVKLVLGNICAGIDVSSHNGSIDWGAVKSDSDFAIIRCGYGQNWDYQDDKTFETNIEGCIANGIPVEVYLYSYADTPAKASSEADHVIRLCNKYKHYIRKIWYDVEDDSVFSQISNGSISKETLGQIVDTFASRLRSQGYSVGLYTYISALNSYFPSRMRSDYEIWIAHYPGDSQDAFENLYNKYKLLFKMWQFTSSGTISGIKGDVDMSIRF